MSNLNNYGQSGEPTPFDLDTQPINSDKRRRPASVKANRIALAARLERNRIATLKRLQHLINSHPDLAANLSQHLPSPPLSPPEPPS